MSRNTLLIIVLVLLAVAGGAAAWHAGTKAPVAEPDPVPSAAADNEAETEGDVQTTPPAAQDDSFNGVRVVSTSGKAPFTVTITGPANLLERIEDCVYSYGWFGPSGNGLTVNWGDGAKEPQPPSEYPQERESCTEVVKTHTYTEPGTYLIMAKLWHPGPTDAPVTDWSGEVEVLVTE